jgi:hypothetical protein
LDEQQLYSDLKELAGGNKRLLTEIFKLDGIVFQEILQTSQLK